MSINNRLFQRFNAPSLESQVLENANKISENNQVTLPPEKVVIGQEEKLLETNLKTIEPLEKNDNNELVNSQEQSTNKLEKKVLSEKDNKSIISNTLRKGSKKNKNKNKEK